MTSHIGHTPAAALASYCRALGWSVTFTTSHVTVTIPTTLDDDPVSTTTRTCDFTPLHVLRLVLDAAPDEAGNLGTAFLAYVRAAVRTIPDD